MAKALNYIKIFFNTALVVFLALTVLILTSIVYSNRANKGTVIFGNQYIKVLTDSMEGEINPGDIIAIRQIPFEHLSTGDIITYRTTISGREVLITHRIVQVFDGYVRTQGDRFDEYDPLRITAENYVGRYQFTSKPLTMLLGFLSSRTGFYVAVLLPSMLSVMLEIVRLIYVIRSRERIIITWGELTAAGAGAAEAAGTADGEEIDEFDPTMFKDID